MIFAILAFYFGYKKGKESGCGGLKWSLICGLTFLGIQIAVSVVGNIVAAFGIGAFGWKESVYDGLQIIITLASIVLSAGALLLMLRFLDTRPIDRDDDLPPPPPPPPSSPFSPSETYSTFGQGQ